MSRTRTALFALLAAIALCVSLFGVSPKMGPLPSSGQPAEGKKFKAPAFQGARPIGTWKRTLGTDSVLFQIDAESLRGTICRQLDEGRSITVDFRADYGTSKDGILFGLVTSAAARIKSVGRIPPLPEHNRETLKIEKAFIDAPFSLRFRVDEDTLTIKDFRVDIKGGVLDEDELTFYTGRYSKQ